MIPAPIDLPAQFHWDGEQIAIELPGAHVVFTTRRGGHSRGPYASLNLGRRTDDDRDAVQANLRTVAVGYGVGLAWGRQLHGAEVVVHETGADPIDPTPSPLPGDGRVTATAGVAPMVLTADCLAIAVAAAGTQAGGGAVAMLHAGWRGLAGGVIGAGVERLRELAPDGRLEAAIGPHARACCYEVGEEVHAAFAAAGYDGRVEHSRKLDLTRIAARQLTDAGVAVVHDLGLCTICGERSLFFSHRREHGVTGRQAGLAWLG